MKKFQFDKIQLQNRMKVVMRANKKNLRSSPSFFNVSHTTAWRIISGKDIDIETLLNICNARNWDPSDFFRRM